MTNALDFSFSKELRLLNAFDYKAVFDHVDGKVSTKEILCLSRKNTLNHPRLGIIIAKKNVKLAVQRNRIKRVLRESFRHQQHSLPAVDCIILAKRGLDKFDSDELHAQFASLWLRVNKKFIDHAARSELNPRTQPLQ